ncbi:MAG: hypothetical protein A3D92_06595 [Bacteroidetes bacterium RIFCSPHIGHO2_02_FULL_44_7]|nr:MAG: hypothetical protein A3D92_06595 [Bacteroidetes bacterium RIFCSPHIGHO2_02_FULL_44_7]
MIRSLRIENFALIDSLAINFNSGFTVITGETGSGKSILLNALNLILGERANFNVIGPRSDKASVEAEIDISGFGMQELFAANELDYDDHTIVRREISSQGRSRAFINDTPVQLTVLKEFSSQLIQIHSQYNTLELKDRQFQLHVLDVLADCMGDRKSFSSSLLAFRARQQKLEELRADLARQMTLEDYNAFQLQELEALRLEELDYEALNEEVKRGEHADEIRLALSEVEALLNNEMGIITGLTRAKSALAKRKDFDANLNKLHERLNSIMIEAIDVAEEAVLQSEKVDFNPERVHELTGLLDAYNRAAQKHASQSQRELLELMKGLDTSAENLDRLRGEIAKLEVELVAEQGLLLKAASTLHVKRKKAIPQIEQALQSSLHALKLEDTRLEFRLQELTEMNATGNSALEIYFSPNKGIAPVPVHEAASGGELSRVMLALQSLMSARVQLRTILFDEIDTGVSGDVAQKMGAMLKQMGATMQVIAITHLPQVAAKGGQHLKVQKSLNGKATQTSVLELTLEERIEETARLMSGDTISPAALETAKALMN